MVYILVLHHDTCLAFDSSEHRGKGYYQSWWHQPSSHPTNQRCWWRWWRDTPGWFCRCQKQTLRADNPNTTRDLSDWGMAGVIISVVCSGPRVVFASAPGGRSFLSRCRYHTNHKKRCSITKDFSEWFSKLVQWNQTIQESISDCKFNVVSMKILVYPRIADAHQTLK